jgi:hypothetical protein
MMWRVTEAPWRVLQRSLCCSFAAFSWFWGLVSSQYLISTWWMSRRCLLRSLGWCCLGLVALLVAGGAAEVLPVSLNCSLSLRRTHPLTLVCCFCVFAAMGVTSTKSGRLEVNLSLSGKRGGKSHLGTILLSAVSGIWSERFWNQPCEEHPYSITKPRLHNTYNVQVRSL